MNKKKKSALKSNYLCVKRELRIKRVDQPWKFFYIFLLYSAIVSLYMGCVILHTNTCIVKYMGTSVVLNVCVCMYVCNPVLYNQKTWVTFFFFQ